MTENREGFDLNRLDQQIEYPAGSLDAQASQLVDDLHQMYQASPTDSRANAESLRRVQQRLQTRFAPAPQETKPVSLRALPTRQERKSFMQEKNSERKSGWKRVSRTFNTLAAVLVVAILIGSAVTLVNLRNHAQNTQVGSTKQATPTPQPSHDCSHVFSEFNPYTNSQMPNNGEHAVCLQGLETALHGTKEVNGQSVTLISAYADANQMLLKYAVNDYHPNDFRPVASINLQDGTELQFEDAGIDPYYDAQQQQEIMLLSYDTQKVPASTTSLHLTATLSGFTTNGLGSVTSSGSATFDFTIPFHTEERIATLNKTAKIDGHTFTLDRVVVTPSETIIHLKVDPALAGSPAGALDIEGNLNGNTLMITGDESFQGKTAPQAGYYGFARADFMNKQDVWTLTLQGTGASRSPLGNASGTIQFTVPPAA